MLNWSEPLPTNGIIEGYQIFLNNNLVYNQQVTYNNILPDNYSIVSNLIPKQCIILHLFQIIICIVQIHNI